VKLLNLNIQVCH